MPNHQGSRFIHLKELNMKKLTITVASLISLVAALPAVAGPDMQMIEKGRQAKQQQNEQRMEMERMMKTCSDMMKKSD